MSRLTEVETILDKAAPAPRRTTAPATSSGEWIEVPRWAQRHLGEPADGDRSARTFAAVAALYDAGAPDDQIVELVSAHAPTVAKYGPDSRGRGDRRRAEIERSLAALRRDREPWVVTKARADAEVARYMEGLR